MEGFYEEKKNSNSFGSGVIITDTAIANGMPGTSIWNIPHQYGSGDR
jgi:hypothetical protein